jgi:hypothetical protein
VLKVQWLLPYAVPTLEDLGRVSLASVRLRAHVAINGAAGQGADDIRFSAGDSAEDDVDVLVVGKFVPDPGQARAERWLGAIAEVKRCGGVVIVDYTDDHLSLHTPHPEFYRAAFKDADMAVAPSHAMRANLEAHWAGRIAVVEDAIEVAVVAPKRSAGKPPRALWFGHETNLSYLLQFIQSWDLSTPLVLKVLSGPRAQPLLEQAGALPEGVSVELAEWSVPAMLAAAQEADYCLIPGDPADVRKRGASSNRLITSLALGLPTAADLLDSYREFAAYFTDIRSPEFRTLAAQPTAFATAVEQAQRLVVPRFGQAVIAAQWRKLLRDCAAR